VWAHCHCKGLFKWKRAVEKKSMDRRKLEDGKLLTLQVEPREMSPQKTGNAPKLEKAREQMFPESLKKETYLSFHLGLNPETPFQMCDLLNHKTINACSLKPLTPFVIVYYSTHQKLTYPTQILKSYFLFHSLSFLHLHRLHQIRSDQSLSHVWLFATPWIAARQASLSITNSQSSLRLMSIESVMPSSHLILCRPLPSPLDLPNSEIEPRSPTLQADSLLTEPQGEPKCFRVYVKIDRC